MIHIFTVDRAIELGQAWADGIVKSSTGATSILPQGVRGSEWATLFASEPSGELLEETHARPSPGKCRFCWLGAQAPGQSMCSASREVMASVCLGSPRQVRTLVSPSAERCIGG